jgi:hypothetical protein
MTPLRPRGSAALLAASALSPAALVGWMSFANGGNPSGVAGAAAVALAIILAGRLLVAPETVHRPSGAVLVALAALAALAGWTLVSMLWSGAEDRAVRDFCRTVLYVVLVASIATLPPWTLRWLLRSLAGVLALLGVLAFLSRGWPELVDARNAASPRVLYPLGYWNALAFMVGTGLLLLVHMSSDAQERSEIRIASAGLVPPLACALYLTQSRGAIAIGLLGALLYLALTRSKGVVATVVAVALPTTVAVAVAYASVSLITDAWRLPEGTSDGHRLLVVVALASLAAGWSRRYLLARADETLIKLPRLPRRLVAVIGLALVFGALAVGAPAALERQFFGGGPDSAWTDPRTRLTNTYSNGRVDLWRAAGADFQAHPLTGAGAGTFAARWARERRDESDAVDAHSLYVEVLGELGIVGLFLVATFVAALTIAVVAAPIPQPLRALAVGVTVMWALDAAIEWLWEIPAASVPVLALAAAVGSWHGHREGGARRVPRASLGARSLVASMVVALAAVPAAEAAGSVLMERAARAYDAGDCTRARTRAASAARVAPWRAAPHALAGLCSARMGNAAKAKAAIAAAIARDPADSQLQIVMAIANGVAGGDPRPALRRAVTLNPRGTEARLLYAFAVRGRPVEWPRLFRATFPMIDRRVYMPMGPRKLCVPGGAGYWGGTTWTTLRCR